MADTPTKGIQAEPWPVGSGWEVVADDTGAFVIQIKVTDTLPQLRIRQQVYAGLLSAGSDDPTLRLEPVEDYRVVDGVRSVGVLIRGRDTNGKPFAILSVRGVLPQTVAASYEVTLAWAVDVPRVVVTYDRSGARKEFLPPIPMGVVRSTLRVYRAGIPLPPLDWFQAAFLAKAAGVYIRRSGWADRFVRYYRSFWWLHTINATTKQELSAAPVEASQWTDADFRARDFVVYGRGITDAALRDQALAIRKSFPK